MKREDVKQKIPGITDEQLQWLMDENGADVTREKKRAGDLQAELDTATAQLKTAQAGLAAFVVPIVLNVRRNSDTLYRTICVCPNPDFLHSHSSQKLSKHKKPLEPAVFGHFKRFLSGVPRGIRTLGLQSHNLAR